MFELPVLNLFRSMLLNGNIIKQGTAIKCRAFTVFIFLFFCYAAISQPAALLKNDSLDAYIKQAVKNWAVPGLAVCVIKDGEVYFQQGYGVRNRETGEPVDEETVFPLASITKTFTGSLLATLEAAGKVSLNDPVIQWLPWFSMKQKLYEQQITLADILSHRSGWKTFQGDLLNTESTLNFKDMLLRFGQQTPAYPIRTKYGYSNFGFILAGEVVNAVTGDSWSRSLYNYFLRPLGMNRTFVTDTFAGKDPNMASRYSKVDTTLTALEKGHEKPYSHGGVYSSIRDMGTWMRMLLNKGTYSGKCIIPESALSKMWTSYTIIGKGRAADRQFYLKTYGLGWEIMQYGTTEVIQHSGAYSGSLSSLALVPGLQLGIAILTNYDDHLLHETIKWQIIDAFIGKAAPDYSRTFLERQNARKTNVAGPAQQPSAGIAETFALPMDSVCGTYVCDGYGKAFIQKENNDYVLRLEFHPQLKGVFSAGGRYQLLCTYNQPMFGKKVFSFIIDRTRVSSFTLFVDSFVEADGYVFTKL